MQVFKCKEDLLDEILDVLLFQDNARSTSLYLLSCIGTIEIKGCIVQNQEDSLLYVEYILELDDVSVRCLLKDLDLSQSRERNAAPILKHQSLRLWYATHLH